MSSPLLPCSVCLRPIPQAEFDRHRAVTLLKRRFCGPCADALTSHPPPAPPSTARHFFVAGIAGVTSLALILYVLIAVARWGQ